MFTQRLLQIVVALQASLALAMVGVGHRRFELFVLAMVLVGVAVYVTDIAKWIQLSRPVGNAAALLAVGLAFFDVYRYGFDNALLSVTDLLICMLSFMIVISAFQRKSPRIYWNIGSMSLLLVMVASAMDQSVWFGLMLVVYVITSLLALMLLTLYSQSLTCRASVDLSSRSEENDLSAAALASNKQMHSKVAEVSPDISGGTKRQSSREVFIATRRGFSPFAASHDPLGAANGPELYRRLIEITIATLVLTALFFMYMPRLSDRAWRGMRRGAVQSTVGFNDSVRLGAMGRILENPDKVMQVTLTELAEEPPQVTGMVLMPEEPLPPIPETPYQVDGGIYLRGATLNEYTRGAWGYRRYGGTDRKARVPDRPPIKQTIRIEPLRRRELFAIYPFEFLPEYRYVGSNQPHLFAYGDLKNRLFRSEQLKLKTFTYSLLTAAFKNNRQAELIPCDDIDETTPAAQRSGLPIVAETARKWRDQWCKETGKDSDQHYLLAKSFANRFVFSGDFKYSLDGVARDPDLDPIEDFLSKNRVGHCEYYATALTLMLREVGIPARVVLGYRTEEYDDAGQCFRVRQLHAHAWVEAFIDQDQLPDGLTVNDNEGRWFNGGWLRLDPTPGGIPSAGMFTSMWEDYIVEMNRGRQKRAVYEPMLETIKSAWSKVTDPAWWKSLGDRLAAWIGLEGFGTVVLVLLFLTAMALVALVLWLLRRRIARLLRFFVRLLRRGGDRRRAAAASVDFFRRFERVLARRGFVRQPGQTHRRFVRESCTELAREIAEANAANGEDAVSAESIDRQIIESGEVLVNAYYKVRFGRATLGVDDAERVRSALEYMTTVAKG